MSIFKGIRFIGILVGWLVDEGLTECILITTGIAVAVLMQALGNGEFTPRTLQDSTLWIVFGFVIGNSCTMLGGFVSGCIAKSHRIKNGLALWVFEYIRDFLDWFYPMERSLWYRTLEEFTLLGAACLGAWIAKLILGPGKIQ